MMVSQKSTTVVFSSFPRKRESRNFRRLQTDWIPAFAGMTTFCECINICFKKIPYRKELNNDSNNRPSLSGQNNRGSRTVPPTEKKSQHPCFTRSCLQ